MGGPYKMIMRVLVPGYVGKNCETQFADCATSVPCLNGGICIPTNTPPNYRCTCEPGYSGTSCENNIDECDPSMNPLITK